jgi:hypothetical protein
MTELELLRGKITETILEKSGDLGDTVFAEKNRGV